MKSDKIPFPAQDGSAWRVIERLRVTHPNITITWIQGSAGIILEIDHQPVYIGTYQDFKESILEFFTEVGKHLG